MTWCELPSTLLRSIRVRPSGCAYLARAAAQIGDVMYVSATNCATVSHQAPVRFMSTHVRSTYVSECPYSCTVTLGSVSERFSTLRKLSPLRASENIWPAALPRVLTPMMLVLYQGPLLLAELYDSPGDRHPSLPAKQAYAASSSFIVAAAWVSVAP